VRGSNVALVGDLEGKSVLLWVLRHPPNGLQLADDLLELLPVRRGRQGFRTRRMGFPDEIF